MRRLAIAGLLLTACTLAAQENPSSSGTATAPPKSDTWLSGIWGGKDNPEPKKPAPAAKKAAPKAESAASRWRRESAVLDRRNEVILKLREIAGRTGDDALLLKADELEQRALDLYMQKTTGLFGDETQGTGKNTRAIDSNPREAKR